MLLPNEFIPADKIDPKPFSEGSRVRVHRLRGVPELEGRLIRVPKDVAGDPAELVQMQMLKAGPLVDFLPAPQLVRAEIGDQVRCVVSSLEVKSSMGREFPGVGAFGSHLLSRSTLDDKIQFLCQLRGFIQACKDTYWQSNILPDLIGKGNIVAHGTTVSLLDFNNISGKWTVDGPLDVPVDDQGLPIFDMGLELMHRMEKGLLTNRGGNFSTDSFNREFRKGRPGTGLETPSELASTLVSGEALKKDSFYGALRFQARREGVAAILDRYDRVGRGH